MHSQIDICIHDVWWDDLVFKVNHDTNEVRSLSGIKVVHPKYANRDDIALRVKMSEYMINDIDWVDYIDNFTLSDVSPILPIVDLTAHTIENVNVTYDPVTNILII